MFRGQTIILKWTILEHVFFIICCHHSTILYNLYYSIFQIFYTFSFFKKKVEKQNFLQIEKTVFLIFYEKYIFNVFVCCIQYICWSVTNFSVLWWFYWWHEHSNLSLAYSNSIRQQFILSIWYMYIYLFIFFFSSCYFLTANSDKS